MTIRRSAAPGLPAVSVLSILSILTLWGSAMSTAGGVEIERAHLENGLEVILAPKEGVPLVTVEIAVRAGSFIESPELDGLTHLHEHMFFKANRAIPDQEAYLRRLDELGMSWNGSTSNEVVRYFFTMPAELLEEGLVFMRDAIQSPLFLEEELEKERKVVLGEYDRWEANPASHLRREVNRGLFRRYFSRKNPIGDRGVIGTATRDKLQYIQDEFYVPNNSALIITGEFDPATAFELAERLFSGWERRPDPFARNPVPAHPPVLRSEYHVVTKPVQAVSVLVGWHGPSVAENPRMTVVADLLSRVLEQATGRFQRALVDSGLCASATFGYYTQKYVGPLYLSVETRPEAVLDALRRARAEIDALVEGGTITVEELERAKRDIIRDEVFEREKARDFAIALGFWWSAGGTQYYLDYPEIVREVTLEEIQALARRYLTRPHVAGVLISEDAAAKHGITSEAMEKAFEGTHRKEGRVELARAVLPSGMRVITRTLPAAEVAAFQIHFPAPGARVSEEKAGIEQMLLRTIVERLERTRVDVLNRLGTRVYSEARPDFSMVGLECLRGSLERSVELLAGALLDAEFDESDVERTRQRMLAEFARQMDHPQRKVSYIVNRSFYPEGHPYRAYPGGTADSLPGITIEDLRAHRKKLLAARNIVVVAVGSIAAEETGVLAGRALGEVSPGESVSLTLPELGGREGERLHVEKSDIPSNYILAKFRAPSPGDPDHDACRLALRVLGRKLWLEVRSKRALTYAVGSGLIPRARSMGYLSISTTRPNEALRVIYDTVDHLIAEPLPESELRAAARAFATSELLARETPREQGVAIARAEILTGDLDRAFDIPLRLGAVTPADVQRVLGKWVRDLHFAVIGPAADLDRELFTSR